MNKQILSLLLSALMVLMLASCGNVPGSSSQTAISPSEQTAPVQPAGQLPAPPTQGTPGGQPPAQPQGQYEPVELAVSSDTIDAIMNSYSGKAFKEGVVPDDALEAILQSGQKAPSAMNAQPWHFTVIKNSEIAAGLVLRKYVEGAVVIVVSGKPDEKVGVDTAFDCALATQNMYIAAQSLASARNPLSGNANYVD